MAARMQRWLRATAQVYLATATHSVTGSVCAGATATSRRGSRVFPTVVLVFCWETLSDAREGLFGRHGRRVVVHGAPELQVASGRGGFGDVPAETQHLGQEVGRGRSLRPGAACSLEMESSPPTGSFSPSTR